MKKNTWAIGGVALIFRHKFRRLAACAVSIALLAGVFAAPGVSASSSTVADLQKKYDSLVEQQKQIDQQRALNKKNQSDAKTAQSALSQNISLVNSQISILLQKMDLLDDQISQRESDIATAQKSIDANVALFKQRLRAMYMEGNASFLEVLLSSRNLTDFFLKEEILRSISVTDTNLIGSLRVQQQKLKKDKDSLEADRSNLQSTRCSLTAKQQDLNSKIAQSQKLLSSLKDTGDSLDAQKQKIQEEMDQANSQIEALQSNGNYVGGNMLWPLQGVSTTLTSTFTYRSSPTTGYHEFHTGIDITKSGGGTYGYPIRAANDGTVALAQYSNVSYGNHIVIDHGGGMMTLYGHCSSFASDMKVGLKVKKGDIIAYVGSTGNSTGPHLHFSVLINNVYVNPLNYSYINENCTNSNYYRHVGNYYSTMPR